MPPSALREEDDEAIDMTHDILFSEVAAHDAEESESIAVAACMLP